MSNTASIRCRTAPIRYGRPIVLGHREGGPEDGAESPRIHPLRAEPGRPGAGAEGRQVSPAHGRCRARGIEETQMRNATMNSGIAMAVAALTFASGAVAQQEIGSSEGLDMQSA